MKPIPRDARLAELLEELANLERQLDASASDEHNSRIAQRLQSVLREAMHLYAELPPDPPQVYH